MKLQRLKKDCPNCRAGVRMAVHEKPWRYYCGSCFASFLFKEGA